MNTPHPQLDIVTVAIALSTWAVGAELAQYVGPYSVIILGAIGGATWSASSRPSGTRWDALGYVAWMVGLALIATVPLAELVARATGVAPRWMFAPVAVVIAARPHWVIAQARRWFASRKEDAP
jgi:hypothetical protein